MSSDITHFLTISVENTKQTVHLFPTPSDDEQPEPQKKSNGKRGVVSEKELYSVPLEDEDNELEQALARSRR